jgi:hypothetical protein
VTEYVESMELCFEKKEVVVTKAIGRVNGKTRNLIKEKSWKRRGLFHFQ